MLSKGADGEINLSKIKGKPGDNVVNRAIVLYGTKRLYIIEEKITLKYTKAK